MELNRFSSSKTYFDFFQEIEQPVICRWNSLGGRISALNIFFEFLLILPFGLCYKACQTFFRAAGFFFSGFLLFLTLGTSSTARGFFVERVSSFTRDLADWVLLPFALSSCFVRLVLSLLIHPSLFLRF